MANATLEVETEAPVALEWDGERLRVYLTSEYTSLLQAERWRSKVEKAGFVAVMAPSEKPGALLPVGVNPMQFTDCYRSSAAFRRLLVERLKQRKPLDDLFVALP